MEDNVIHYTHSANPMHHWQVWCVEFGNFWARLTKHCIFVISAFDSRVDQPGTSQIISPDYIDWPECCICILFHTSCIIIYHSPSNICRPRLMQSQHTASLNFTRITDGRVVSSSMHLILEVVVFWLNIYMIDWQLTQRRISRSSCELTICFAWVCCWGDRWSSAHFCYHCSGFSQTCGTPDLAPYSRIVALFTLVLCFVLFGFHSIMWIYMQHTTKPHYRCVCHHNSNWSFKVLRL